MADAGVRDERGDLVVGVEVSSCSVCPRQEDLLHAQGNLVDGPHALPTQQLLFEAVVVQALGDLSLQARPVALQILCVTDSLGDLGRLFWLPQTHQRIG